jgi:hypothetical protein
MATLDQRLQVLIDDERLRRVRAAAKLDGVSVGEWVRGLIDEQLGVEDRAAKIRAFIEYANAIEPLDIDGLQAVHEARDARAEQLLNVAPADDGHGRAA